MPTLPFLSRAQLVGQGGAPILEEPSGSGSGSGDDGAPVIVPCSIWPATSSSVSRSGVHHTHTAEADYAFRDELTVDNRSLVLEGKRYKIIEATPMDLVEHVVLLLKHTPAAG